MALLLTESQDQALLALIVDEARRAADEKDWYVGRTAIQKLVYFAQRSGVPCGYRFDLHHYGPYCADISRDAEWLIADGVISDSAATERYSNYGPGHELDHLLKGHAAFVQEYRATISQLVGALVPLNPQRLELLATLDFVYRWVRGSGRPAPWKQPSVDRFMEVKQGKFDRSDVEQVYDSMVKTGVFQP